MFRLDIPPEDAKGLAERLGDAAAAGLFHPAIVEPLAAGVEGTVAWRAEEYVTSESLDVAVYSPESPLGAAIDGLYVGDTAVITAPKGARQLTIIAAVPAS